MEPLVRPAVVVNEKRLRSDAKNVPGAADVKGGAASGPPGVKSTDGTMKPAWAMDAHPRNAPRPRNRGFQLPRSKRFFVLVLSRIVQVNLERLFFLHEPPRRRTLFLVH
jgi:hypothetical protein